MKRVDEPTQPSRLSVIINFQESYDMKRDMWRKNTHKDVKMMKMWCISLKLTKVYNVLVSDCEDFT